MSESALDKFKEFGGFDENLRPIERLRFFCSLCMEGQDWFDVEQFFTSISEELALTKQKLDDTQSALKLALVRAQYARKDLEAAEQVIRESQHKMLMG